MTIECYFKDCKYHSIHSDPDDGPFCYEEYCKASEEEIVEFTKLRQELLRSYEQVDNRT